MDNRRFSGLDKLRSGKRNISTVNNTVEEPNERMVFNEEETYPSERMVFNEEETYPNERVTFDSTYPNTNLSSSVEPFNRNAQYGSMDYRESVSHDIANNNYQRSMVMEDFLKEKSIVDNNTSSIEMVNDVEVVSTSLDKYEEKSVTSDITTFPSVRSLIRKTAVVKEVPKIKLEVVCDTFSVSISADNINSAINEFRKECSKGGLDDLTKSIAIAYKEDLCIDSDALDCTVKSDFEISNYTTFDENQVITVGMAIEALFDRIGIGYLLN